MPNAWLPTILAAMTFNFFTFPIRRRHVRVEAAMTVRCGGGTGVTRNVSEGGLYFEMESAADIGSEISFDIEMETPLGGMKLKGNGQVMRKERKGSRTGIAVKVIESRLETTGQPCR